MTAQNQTILIVDDEPINLKRLHAHLASHGYTIPEARSGREVLLKNVLDALEFGAVDYLKKPLDMELLKAVVSEAVGRYGRWYELIRMELKSKQSQTQE